MLDLDPSEKIILKIRRHKLALVFESLFLLFFIILPPFLFWISRQAVSIDGSEVALFFGIYSAILLIAWVIFFILWTDYYLDVLIVTDKKIIDIEQRGFFRREVSTVRLDNVEDVTISVHGILATFLNYGTLKIQTAAESREFIINDVPEPNRIKAVIYDLHNKMVEAPKPVHIIPPQ